MNGDWRDPAPLAPLAPLSLPDLISSKPIGRERYP